MKKDNRWIRHTKESGSGLVETDRCLTMVTHWGRVTHISVCKLTIIGSDNGLSPGRRQAIIWINAGISLIRTLATNFSEILIEVYAFSCKKMNLKLSSGNWRPFCLGLNVVTHYKALMGSSSPDMVVHLVASEFALLDFKWRNVYTFTTSLESVAITFVGYAQSQQILVKRQITNHIRGYKHHSPLHWYYVPYPVFNFICRIDSPV